MFFCDLLPKYDDLMVFKKATACRLGFFVCLHHREEHLMVFVIVQNLVGIDEVVSII